MLPFSFKDITRNRRIRHRQKRNPATNLPPQITLKIAIPVPVLPVLATFDDEGADLLTNLLTSDTGNSERSSIPMASGALAPVDEAKEEEEVEGVRGGQGEGEGEGDGDGFVVETDGKAKADLGVDVGKVGDGGGKREWERKRGGVMGHDQ